MIISLCMLLKSKALIELTSYLYTEPYLASSWDEDSKYNTIISKWEEENRREIIFFFKFKN